MAEKLVNFFGMNLARLLADKIVQIGPTFPRKKFLAAFSKKYEPLTLTQRVEWLADLLKQHLPDDYETAVALLVQIMGDENPNETGMFTNYYWLMPVEKFIEKYGTEHFDASVNAIAELTKRNTGEYAIRPFIEKYPRPALAVMKKWARAKNFHLRRLASEGLRPRLPWAKKMTRYIENPKPVFEILTLLQTDDVRFVRKSVANNLRDYTQENPAATRALLAEWERIENPNTRWIVKQVKQKLK